MGVYDVCMTVKFETQELSSMGTCISHIRKKVLNAIIRKHVNISTYDFDWDWSLFKDIFAASEHLKNFAAVSLSSSWEFDEFHS